MRLTEEENTTIVLNRETVEEAQRKGDRSLVGKLCMNWSIGKEVIASTIAKVWKLKMSKPVVFHEFGPNVFVTLAIHANKQRVMEGRPWLFDKVFSS